MRRHPLIGFEMIQDAISLADALPVVRSHHERWDGGGYPDRLIGSEIPLAARIFSIADAFDAIVSDRPYRHGQTIAEALKRIEAGAGTQFDPILAISFVAMMSEERRERFRATRDIQLRAA